MNEINVILQDEYDLKVKNISSATGGLSALAYKVDSDKGMFWLKQYRKKKINTINQLTKIDLCMNVAIWLENNTGLKGKINVPILTKQNKVRAQTHNNDYLLFSYINGTVPQTTPLTTHQQEEIAEIAGELHQHGANIPYDFSSIKETYNIPCSEILNAPHKPNDSFCVYREYDVLMRAVDKAFYQAEQIRAKKLPFVICHADIHGWNLIQSDRIILIDWESIKFAPAETDLYTFWGDWCWGDSNWGSYWNLFFPAYLRSRPDFIVCEEALKFYQLRRHIEDIEEFYKEYIYDDIPENEKREIEIHLEREIKFLKIIMQLL